eukprot:scaffold7326_cov183-Isochrysis_galbana.AAC.1
MAPPKWFNEDLNNDVLKLVWDRQIDFDPEEQGSTKLSRAWIKKAAVYHTRKINQDGDGLGLGLIDWESHCSAIRISWLLKYRRLRRPLEKRFRRMVRQYYSR